MENALKNDFEWLEDDYKYEIIFSLKHLAQIRLSLLTFQTVKKKNEEMAFAEKHNVCIGYCNEQNKEKKLCHL